MENVTFFQPIIGYCVFNNFAFDYFSNVGLLGFDITIKAVFQSIVVLNCDYYCCLLYTSPSPRDVEESRMPSSA